MAIRKLSVGTINRIAAGEVVERPASALKELIENALDAGATSVRITLEGGGRDLILIEDNGKGISEDDLLMAIEPHATSKLMVDDEGKDDLVHIDTLGFRGEALASIASISRLRITSRPANNSMGASLMVEGGVITEPVCPAGYTYGTRIEVRDLFYTTPARLKFLKNERAELLAITDQIKRLAMAFPQVSFTLLHKGKTVLSYQNTTDNSDERCLFNRLKDVLGQDFADNSFPVVYEKEGYSVSGLASKPSFYRTNAQNLYLFVNGRCIKDKMLTSIAKVSYQGFMEREHYPVLALFLTMPTELVDVNAHPAKTEVRFRESDTVRRLLIQALKQGLEDHNGFTAPVASLNALNHLMQSSRSSLPEEPKPIFTSPVPSSSFSDSQASRPTPYQSYRGGNTNHHGFTPRPINQGHSGFKPLEAPLFEFARTQQANTDIPLVEEETSSALDVNIPPLGYAKAQIGLTYIVAENDKGLVLVDQHAAHERIVLETLKNNQIDTILNQPLLVPDVVHLTIDQKNILMEHQGTLKSFGILIEPFGENAILVRSLPVILEGLKSDILIPLIADELLEQGHSEHLSEKLAYQLATQACHASVRAGRRLSIEEMNALLRQMEQTPHAGHCNHGRPTTITLGYKEIEKLFGR